jgi:hypothetical protein
MPKKIKLNLKDLNVSSFIINNKILGGDVPTTVTFIEWCGNSENRTACENTNDRRCNKDPFQPELG